MVISNQKGVTNKGRADTPLNEQMMDVQSANIDTKNRLTDSTNHQARY